MKMIAQQKEMEEKDIIKSLSFHMSCKLTRGI